MQYVNSLNNLYSFVGITECICIAKTFELMNCVIFSFKVDVTEQIYSVLDVLRGQKYLVQVFELLQFLAQEYRTLKEDNK